ADPRLVLVHAGDVDDPTASPGGNHPPRGALQAEEGTVEVRGKDLPPGAVVQVQQGRRVPGAGVVHQDVDPAQRLGHLVDDVGRLGEPGEIEVPDLGPSPEGAHLLCGGLPRGLVPVPGDADVAALLGQGDGDRPAD